MCDTKYGRVMSLIWVVEVENDNDAPPFLLPVSLLEVALGKNIFV